MPRDPVTVIAGSLEDYTSGLGNGNYIVTGHSDGSVSLFLEQLEGAGIGAPTLIDVDDQYPDGLSSLGFDPLTRSIYGTTRSDAVLVTGGIALNPTMVDRSFVYASTRWRYEGLDDGSDTRDVQIASDIREAYVVSRLPRALLIVDLDRQATSDTVAVSRMVPIGSGPSRVATAYFPDEDKRFVFVSCFDNPVIYIVDPHMGRLGGTVAGFNGPFDLAVDVERKLIYVGDFSNSVLRVIDLADMLRGEGSAKLIANFGEENPIKEIQ